MTRRGEKAGAGRGRHRAVWLVIGRLARVTLRRYIGGGLLWVAFFVIPLVTGLVLQALFDAISGQRAVSLESALWLCAAFVAVEAVRGGVFWIALTLWPYWWVGAGTTLRANTLRSILTARGAGAPPPAAGAGGAGGGGGGRARLIEVRDGTSGAHV
jgi:ATP-binding cassette subfamily B protein